MVAKGRRGAWDLLEAVCCPGVQFGKVVVKMVGVLPRSSAGLKFGFAENGAFLSERKNRTVSFGPSGPTPKGRLTRAQGKYLEMSL